MKKYFLFAVFAVLAAGFVTSCSEDSILDEGLPHTQLPGNNSVLALEEGDYTLSLRELNNILDDSYLTPPTDLNAVGGVYWGETYNYVDKPLIEEGFYTFSHSADSTYYPDYGYYVISWSGFTVSSVNDKQNYGFAGTNGSSLWTNHQWGTMAADAAPNATAADPFLVAFWSYFGESTITSDTQFNENDYSLWVRINNGTKAYAANSIEIGLHPWSYYGITTGDGFARPLDKSTDYYSVKIYGVTTGGKFTGPVTHYFLDNRQGKPAQEGYETVDVRTLGEVTHLVFQMETTDVGEWGPNTSFYFCLQDVQVNDL